MCSTDILSVTTVRTGMYIYLVVDRPARQRTREVGRLKKGKDQFGWPENSVLTKIRLFDIMKHNVTSQHVQYIGKTRHCIQVILSTFFF